VSSYFADCSLVSFVIKLHCNRIQAHVFATIMKRSSPLLMYVYPCIIYENDEGYQLDAQIYLLS
jgi:hypothetical protein